jgi:hypothetical protein
MLGISSQRVLEWREMRDAGEEAKAASVAAEGWRDVTVTE